MWVVHSSDAVFQDLYSELQAYVSTPLPTLLGYVGFEVQSEDGLLNKTYKMGTSFDLEVLLLYSGLGLNDPGTEALLRELLCELVRYMYTSFLFCTPGPEAIKYFMLNSAEHEIFPAHNC